MLAMRAIALISILTGCASGLRMTVNDDVVAGLSVQDKAGIIDAQKELDGAKAEQQRTQGDLAKVNQMVLQCDKECSVAEQDATHAVESQKKAEQAGDMEQMNTANKNKEVTAAGQRAADAKSEFVKRKQKALTAGTRAADKHVTAAQARVELEKAKACSARQVCNVDVTQFDAQYQEFQGDYQQAKNEADLRMTEANEAERDWREADKRWQEMRGGH